MFFRKDKVAPEKVFEIADEARVDLHYEFSVLLADKQLINNVNFINAAIANHVFIVFKTILILSSYRESSLKKYNSLVEQGLEVITKDIKEPGKRLSFIISYGIGHMSMLQPVSDVYRKTGKGYEAVQESYSYLIWKDFMANNILNINELSNEESDRLYFPFRRVISRHLRRIAVLHW